MRSIAWDFAADGANVTCVNAALVATDVFSQTVLAEYVPVFFDESKNFRSVFCWTVTPFEIIIQFLLMYLGIKIDNVAGVPRGERLFTFS